MPPRQPFTRHRKRLEKELVDVQSGTLGATEHISIAPDDELDLTRWTVQLRPERGSLYDGGTFVLSVVVGDRYPIEPPNFQFVTPVCHPNVHPKTGVICLDVLGEKWSPASTLHASALAILMLLDAPDPTSPLNCDAGNLLRSGDLRAYNSLVRVHTSLHAARTAAGAAPR
mmetsp:Transcript_3686/g.9217  ORF Transcript_3686/g.9217 Transcript_3686/m.9217 type:complete len:171 (+) Transcript_3686:224-736(+)